MSKKQEYSRARNWTKARIIGMSNTKYKITGTLVNGKRFSPIFTNTPQHYNIYK